MAPHRSFVIKKFHTAVAGDLLTEYLLHRGMPSELVAQASFHVDTLVDLLDDPSWSDLAVGLSEDFHRMNDVCGGAYGVLQRAYERAQIPSDPNEEPEAQAMRLFLRAPQWFEYAFGRYLLIAGGANLNVYPFPQNIAAATEAEVSLFRDDLMEYGAANGRGSPPRVVSYADQGEATLLIQHGSGPRVINLWTEEGDAPLRGRFTQEDVLIYEDDTGLLRIKSTQPSDSDEYLRLFAKHMAGDEALAAEAKRAETYSLVPIQERRFDYGGRGVVMKVEFVKAQMRVYGVAATELIIRASDIRAAFEQDLGGLSFDSGLFTRVWLCFHVHQPGRRKAQVTVEIAPPATFKNLRERWYKVPIERYLQEEGVKLR